MVCSIYSLRFIFSESGGTKLQYVTTATTFTNLGLIGTTLYFFEATRFYSMVLYLQLYQKNMELLDHFSIRRYTYLASIVIFTSYLLFTLNASENIKCLIFHPSKIPVMSICRINLPKRSYVCSLVLMHLNQPSSC